jgi:double-stranded uracil-DNA glycosylase
MRQPGVSWPYPAAMRFTREELEAARDTTVPDLLGPHTRLLFVGINPGLWTAAAQAHFARRGNRFYPALFRAGIVDRLIDASGGYDPDDLTHLVERGIGITNLVRRPTARADELSADEIVAGARSLESLVAHVQPRVVAVLGITAYRTGFDVPSATAGRQPQPLGDSDLWVVPNPSGLNAHANLDDLASAYGEAARAAGVMA